MAEFPLEVDGDQLEMLRWTLHMRRVEVQLTSVTQDIAAGIWGAAWPDELLTTVLHETLGRDSAMLGSKFKKPEAMDRWDTEVLFRGLWQHSIWLEKVWRRSPCPVLPCTALYYCPGTVMLHYKPMLRSDWQVALQHGKGLHEHPFVKLEHFSESIHRVRLSVAHPDQFILPQSVDLIKCCEDATQFVLLLTNDILGKASSGARDLFLLHIMGCVKY